MQLVIDRKCKEPGEREEKKKTLTCHRSHTYKNSFTHQAIRSIVYIWLFVDFWLASIFGAFQSLLFRLLDIVRQNNNEDRMYQ